MGNKLPVSVLTDGDKAMRKAIQNCFPGTRHRLCSWHLHKNSMTNVNAEQGFCREFQTCMATWYTREEFDAAWNDIIVRYKLQNNEWVADTYANRELWAEAYLRGVFFAGMRSTQRCEGMNSYLNRFLHTQLKMFEVVRQFERGHGRIRQKGALAEFESNHGSQVLTTALQSLEKHGAEIYTKQSFKKFRNELKHESLYSIVDKANNASGVNYLLGKYCDDSSNNVVTYEKTNSELHCSCQRFESNGIPCRHILAVVKAENMETIPECCITRRWFKNARSEMGELVGQTVPEDVATSVRYGALSAACNNLSYLASQSRNVFEVVRTEIDGLTTQITDLSDQPPSRMNGNENGSRSHVNREVEDPVIVKTKGRPGSDGKNIVKRARKCSTCRNIGHNKTHCPRLGKPPKIRKTTKVKEKYEQNIAADLESEEACEEACEDQWEYSTMPSPDHNCRENLTISNSDRGPIYYGSSSFTNRAG